MPSPVIPSPFRKLAAYQLSFELARDVHRAVREWPLDDRRSIGQQLRRASASIGANIAEGAGRWHRPDQLRFMRMARGSAYETEHWVALAREASLLDATWEQRNDRVIRALNALINRWPSA